MAVWFPKVPGGLDRNQVGVWKGVWPDLVEGMLMNKQTHSSIRLSNVSCRLALAPRSLLRSWMGKNKLFPRAPATTQERLTTRLRMFSTSFVCTGVLSGCVRERKIRFYHDTESSGRALLKLSREYRQRTASLTYGRISLQMRVGSISNPSPSRCPRRTVSRLQTCRRKCMTMS